MLLGHRCVITHSISFMDRRPVTQQWRLLVRRACWAWLTASVATAVWFYGVTQGRHRGRRFEVEDCFFFFPIRKTQWMVDVCESHLAVPDKPSQFGFSPPSVRPCSPLQPPSSQPLNFVTSQPLTFSTSQLLNSSTLTTIFDPSASSIYSASEPQASPPVPGLRSAVFIV